MSKKDYYEVLGVDRRADEQAIRSAFRKKAGEYHPDRHPDAAPEEKKKMEERFKELGEAYETLSDASKRARYDQFGHAATEGRGPQFRPGQNPFADLGDLGDLVNSFFGGGEAQRGGSNLRVAVELTFEEAAFGKVIEIPVNALGTCRVCGGSGAKKGSRPSTCTTCNGQGQVRFNSVFGYRVSACPDCHGTGHIIKDPCPECRGQGRLRTQRKVKVSIPAGVDEGNVLRVRGEGEAGPNGAPSGELQVEFRIKPHAIFTRDNQDLHCELPLTFTQAALGSDVEVPTLEGKATVKIPPGTQTGKAFRMKGKGLVSPNSRGRGDQLVTVFVETPSHLSAKQKELLEEFSKISGEESTPRRKSFLDKAKEFFS